MRHLKPTRAQAQRIFFSCPPAFTGVVGPQISFWPTFWQIPLRMFTGSKLNLAAMQMTSALSAKKQRECVTWGQCHTALLSLGLLWNLLQGAHVFLLLLLGSSHTVQKREKRSRNGNHRKGQLKNTFHKSMFNRHKYADISALRYKWSSLQVQNKRRIHFSFLYLLDFTWNFRSLQLSYFQGGRCTFRYRRVCFSLPLILFLTLWRDAGVGPLRSQVWICKKGLPGQQSTGSAWKAQHFSCGAGLGVQLGAGASSLGRIEWEPFRRESFDTTLQEIFSHLCSRWAKTNQRTLACMLG